MPNTPQRGVSLLSPSCASEILYEEMLLQVLDLDLALFEEFQEAPYFSPFFQLIPGLTKHLGAKTECLDVC